ncbi:hypothetical protein [Brevibacillus migulae]|uniref:hypothetical protein n=1 Tax=Brevibacillus migulae TaxID=1644114 RepID=UPI00196B8BA9|nr:hypothetical protein [Brevibacillus migulae]
MSLELGAIIAIAMAITSTVSDYLRIPQKLKGWFSLGLIIILHVANELLFNAAGFDWRQTLFQGLTAGLASVGIYSTSKNSWEQWRIFRNGSSNGSSNGNGNAPTASTPPDNIPYV